MILVTVGTEKFPFNRLMKWIDNLIEHKLIDTSKEEIIIQYGSCTIVPKGVQNYSVLKETDFSNLVEQARIIIAHCGEGTIDLLASLNKPFISFNFVVAYSNKECSHPDKFSRPISFIKSMAQPKAITPVIWGVPASNL